MPLQYRIVGECTIASSLASVAIFPHVMALNQINFEFGQEFPSSWDFGKDVLDGFEQFMDTTPNFNSAVSYGAQRLDATTTTSRQNSGDASDSHAEHSGKGRASSERKQQNNRAAQKRFRQRQKVRSVVSPLIKTATQEWTGQES